MQKILMLNYELSPVGGGAGSATYNVAKELVKRGHEVTVLTSIFKGLKKEEVKDGIKIYRVFSLRKGIHDCGLLGAATYLFSAAIKLIQLRRTENYDLLHIISVYQQVHYRCYLGLLRISLILFP